MSKSVYIEILLTWAISGVKVFTLK